MAPPLPHQDEALAFKHPNQITRRNRSQFWHAVRLSSYQDTSRTSDRQSMDADEPHGWLIICLVFKAELDNFFHPLHQFLECVPLRIAATQFRHEADEDPVLILLDHDREFSLGHATPRSENTL